MDSNTLFQRKFEGNKNEKSIKNVDDLYLLNDFVVFFPTPKLLEP